MAQSDKFIAHYSYHYFLLDVLIPVFSEAGRSVFPSLLQASSHPPNKFFSLLKSELISVACHIVLTGRAHRPSLLCRVAHSVWIQKLSHTIWMLEFSLSPLSFCFLMASAASKWKSVCPGQCQGPLLCLEHPVSSQKKKKKVLYTFQDFSQAACLSIKPFLVLWACPSPLQYWKQLPLVWRRFTFFYELLWLIPLPGGPHWGHHSRGSKESPSGTPVYLPCPRMKLGLGSATG